MIVAVSQTPSLQPVRVLCSSHLLTVQSVAFPASEMLVETTILC